MKQLAQAMVDSQTAHLTAISEDMVKRMLECAIPKSSIPSVDIEAIKKSLIPDSLRESMRKVGEGMLQRLKDSEARFWARGWMLHGDFPFMAVEVHADEHEVSDEQLDDWMVEYYRPHIDQIESLLQGSWPKRSGLIGEAITAHKSGQYSFSCLLLLTQIDGVCFDISSVYFFSTNDHKPKISRRVEKYVSDKERLSFLEMINCLNGPDGLVDEKVLNRHRVLHGQDLSYGTEANSLRCISILYYLTKYVAPAFKNPS